MGKGRVLVSPDQQTYSVDRWRQEIFEDLHQLWSGLWSPGVAGQAATPAAARLVLPAAQLNWLLRWGFGQKLIRRLQALALNPHSSLIEQTQSVAIWAADRVDLSRTTELALARTGALTDVACLRAMQTYDTPENRFVAGVVDRFLAATVDLQDRLSDEIERRRRLAEQLTGVGEVRGEEVSGEECGDEDEDGPGSVRQRNTGRTLRELRDQLQAMNRRLRTLRRRVPLVDIEPGRATTVPSVGVVSAPLYASIFSLWRTFERSLLPDPGPDLDIALLDDWRVFELWTVFRVRDRIISALGPDNPEAQSRLGAPRPWFPDESSARHGGQSGSPIPNTPLGPTAKALDLHRAFFWPHHDVELHYQFTVGSRHRRRHGGPPYQSVSLEARPDLLIRKGDQLLIIDAKHKAAEPTKGDTRNDRWGSDAAQLHAYRDCIRVASALSERPVTHALLVYSTPNNTGCPVWQAWGDHNSFKETGLGATQFSTAADARIDNHLDILMEVLTDD